MIRAIADNLPSWLLLTGIPAVYLAISLVGNRVVKPSPEFFTAQGSQSSYWVMRSMTSLLTVVLGFLLVHVYGDYVAAQAIVRDEAVQLEQLIYETRALPEASRSRLDPLIRAYGKDVAQVEWRLMGQNRSSPEVDADIAAMYQALQEYAVDEDAVSSFYSDSSDQLDSLVEERNKRLTEANESFPLPFFLLVVIGSLSIVVTHPLLIRQSDTIRRALFALAAVLLGLAIALVIVLEHPFAGVNAIPPTPIEEALTRLP